MTINHKAIAAEFLQQSSAGYSGEVFKKYVGENFKHHNIYFKGDGTTLMEAMEENAKRSPHQTIEIKKILKEGEEVATHSHVIPVPGQPGIAVVHIFRFENNKIVELWDLGLPIPESIPNENGPF